MDVLIVVNSLAGLKPDQTTSGLIHTVAQRPVRVFVADVGDLSARPDGRVTAQARPVHAGTSPSDTLARTAAVASEHVDLARMGLTWIRTNPARDGALGVMHETALQLLANVADDGGCVLNDPRTLLRATSKLYLHRLPASCRPPTLVSRDRTLLRRFVADTAGRCVLKPLRGTRGEDVFFVDRPDDPNLSQILDVLLREGVAMAQAFVPEAVRGDTRLLLLDGQPLTVDGHVAAVRRVPGAGELRSNVAQGGRPDRPEDLDRTLDVGARMADKLAADGLFFVGVDVIGDVAVEVNVFSPGGLGDAEAHSGVSFLDAVVDAALKKASA